jgi:hypothetical protein
MALPTDQGELTQVTFHYGDQEYFITGEELQKWRDFNAIVARHAQIHGVNPAWEDIIWQDANELKLY